MIYPFLDKFFIVFHSTIILFNLFGWVWKKTRRANLVLLLLTGASWFILGIWYGIGYCPLTDWHWKVIHKMGGVVPSGSYVKYLFDRITGLNFDGTAIDNLTFICFFAALIISAFINWRKS